MPLAAKNQNPERLARDQIDLILAEATLCVSTLSLQQSIVADLHALKPKVDTAQAIQAETTAELDAMLPIILDEAFGREL